MSFHTSKSEMSRRLDFRIGGGLPDDGRLQLFATGRNRPKTDTKRVYETRGRSQLRSFCALINTQTVARMKIRLNGNNVRPSPSGG